MIIDEETYLEHFGVKGMRWGVRKAGNAARRTGGYVRRHPRGTATVVAGAAFAVSILASSGSRKPPSINRDLVTPFMARYGDTPATVWSSPGPFQISQHLNR